MAKNIEIRNSTTEFLIFMLEGKEDGIQVMYKNETVWATQKAMAQLFDVGVPAISKHLKNIFESGELDGNSVISKMETTASDGKNYDTTFYNLDAIISVGYRVNSVRATQFRQWCTLIGHISMLYSTQREKEREIERLRIENLQSRCDALANQINPHFFFNSLNGVQSLIRKKDDEKTLMYVHELSDIFRYILQSDKRGLVTLREELEFIQSFRYVMEVRFANKLIFSIQVDEAMQDKLTLPVLSLLPLVENVTVHNRIDSEHKMEITIRLNEQKELVVSNPTYPKLSPPDTNGTGLRNLESRFTLLMNRQIRIECDENTFRVYLPLNKQN